MSCSNQQHMQASGPQGPWGPDCVTSDIADDLSPHVCLVLLLDRLSTNLIGGAQGQLESKNPQCFVLESLTLSVGPPHALKPQLPHQKGSVPDLSHHVFALRTNFASNCSK